ncbi:uncharacterized protein FOMMEDRAFT_160000 [Fomitiporia mediterranea MF3/22]|uniref:uncharacterized protein n=1 Tax=Fomitiporia mediterranea (strain MF3/22) TaxID=694068 RepID=UPI0004409A83|nr:uncharacterized protein FOMMEDRAFT_160000 [Fomitiporia mediterranea MF3/22]EJC99579.1 hypothetical protein FOMMEDRAFT_160000 [Fomitiporia mediterranea MF3/22]
MAVEAQGAPLYYMEDESSPCSFSRNTVSIPGGSLIAEPIFWKDIHLDWRILLGTRVRSHYCDFLHYLRFLSYDDRNSLNIDKTEDNVAQFYEIGGD